MPDVDDSGVSDPDLSGLQPTLVNTDKRIGHDRRFLIFLVIVPYIFFAGAILYQVLFSDMEQARVTLAASAVLAPLGTLAGAIVAFYFKSG